MLVVGLVGALQGFELLLFLFGPEKLSISDTPKSAPFRAVRCNLAICGGLRFFPSLFVSALLIG